MAGNWLMAEYQISKRTLERNCFWKHVEELLCSRCGENICSGDWIHRNHASPRDAGDPRVLDVEKKFSARFYHLSCWEGLYQ